MLVYLIQSHLDVASSFVEVSVSADDFLSNSTAWIDPNWLELEIIVMKISFIL
jgi:hypothetical protein